MRVNPTVINYRPLARLRPSVRRAGAHLHHIEALLRRAHKHRRAGGERQRGAERDDLLRKAPSALRRSRRAAAVAGGRQRVLIVVGKARLIGGAVGLEEGNAICTHIQTNNKIENSVYDGSNRIEAP